MPRPLHRAYQFLAAMMRGEPTLPEDLAQEFGVDLRTARSHLVEQHRLGLVYICEWDRNYQAPVPVYRWGRKPDVPRPPVRTGAEKARRYRERKARQHAQHAPPP